VVSEWSLSILLAIQPVIRKFSPKKTATYRVIVDNPLLYSSVDSDPGQPMAFSGQPILPFRLILCRRGDVKPKHVRDKCQTASTPSRTVKIYLGSKSYLNYQSDVGHATNSVTRASIITLWETSNLAFFDFW